VSPREPEGVSSGGTAAHHDGQEITQMDDGKIYKCKQQQKLLVSSAGSRVLLHPIISLERFPSPSIRAAAGRTPI